MQPTTKPVQPAGPVAAMNADSAAIAANAIKGISHIATLPEITVSIIELVEDPSSTAQDLNKVISNDPALCSRILKVVNSAFYGLPRQIGSINRAISLLGLNAVKNLAIAASLAKLFKGGALCSRFDARDLWAHSVAVGATSKKLATSLRLSFADEAFLAGLIHDIGVMVELQSDREKLIAAINRLPMDKDGAPTADFSAIERETFGCDHGTFGATLCDAWKFPRSFAYVCGHHHDPRALPHDVRILPWLVHVADRLASAVSQRGYRLDLASLEISDEALAALAMTREQLEAVRAALPECLQEAEANFAVAA
jgi:putative nucleotidyltransferase with HDIG domain